MYVIAFRAKVKVLLNRFNLGWNTDVQVLTLIESEISSKEFRKNWARLIQKIYNVNSLLCSKCSGSISIIAFIEDDQLVKKSLST